MKVHVGNKWILQKERIAPNLGNKGQKDERMVEGAA